MEYTVYNFGQIINNNRDLQMYVTIRIESSPTEIDVRSLNAMKSDFT